MIPINTAVVVYFTHKQILCEHYICTGTAQHAEDEAYEEAAYLKTNRFVAAYVVDEQSRASYVNDLLNERFHYVRFFV